MGQRTVYYQSKIPKTLKEHLIDDFKLFRNWKLTEHFNSIQDYGERLISQRLEEFLRENQSIENLNNFHQEIIDELTLEYLFSFCDYGEGKGKFEIVGPMMGTWRYNSSKKLIEKIEDTELKILWSILDTGRSLIDDKPFLSTEENNLLGFWSPEEQRVLLEKLAEIYKSHPDEKGIEYVITVLKEVQDRSIELIIDIEK